MVSTKLHFLPDSSLKFCLPITEIFLNAFLMTHRSNYLKRPFENWLLKVASNMILFSLANSAWKCNHKSRFHSLVEKYICILLVLGCPYNQLLIGREKQMQKTALPWERVLGGSCWLRGIRTLLCCSGEQLQLSHEQQHYTDFTLFRLFHCPWHSPSPQFWLW